MSEDGYKLQLSVKNGQDMVNVRANTADELQSIVDEAKTKADLARFFGGGGGSQRASATEPTAPSQPEARADSPPSEAEALANIEKHLGAKPAEDPATAAQIAVAAKKSGKSVEELQGISAAEAKALIAGGK